LMPTPDLSVWSDPLEIEPELPTGDTPTGSTVLVDTSNRLSVRKLGDAPTFALDRVQFELPAELVAFAVANNCLAMLLKSCHVLKVDLLQAHDILGTPLSIASAAFSANGSRSEAGGRELGPREDL
ncbi:tethering complex subunit, partial [Massospora cicadina]